MLHTAWTSAFIASDYSTDVIAGIPEPVLKTPIWTFDPFSPSRLSFVDQIGKDHAVFRDPRLFHFAAHDHVKDLMGSLVAVVGIEEAIHVDFLAFPATNVILLLLVVVLASLLYQVIDLVTALVAINNP